MKVLKEDINGLWMDYNNVQDSIVKAKIKTLFYKKQAEYMALLKEDYK